LLTSKQRSVYSDYLRYNKIRINAKFSIITTYTYKSSEYTRVCLSGSEAQRGLGLPAPRGFVITHTSCATVGRTPLDE
jgi:hypothetical protein